ncbi:uncharacterized protein LOC143026555 [Oratosquilla oratoria]|uniref:uncharacterized protein LOC143026555 n=1 Tax=Oratosquilla oratoria TaxID=337810 RepID=UPI003F765C64
MFLFFAFCVLLAFKGVVIDGCPHDFSSLGDTCIKLALDYFENPDAKPFTWDHARQSCQAHSDAHWSVDLVQLKSAQKLEDLSHHIATHHSEYFEFIFFVGASDAGDNIWKWIDGDLVDLDSYIWFPASPSLDSGMQVMTLMPAGHVYDRLYATAHNSNSLAPSFVCEAVSGA